MSKSRWIGFEAHVRLKNVSRSTTRRRYERWSRMYRKALKRYWDKMLERTLKQGFIATYFGARLIVSERALGATGPIQDPPEYLSEFQLWEKKYVHL